MLGAYGAGAALPNLREAIKAGSVTAPFVRSASQAAVASAIGGIVGASLPAAVPFTTCDALVAAATPAASALRATPTPAVLAVSSPNAESLAAIDACLPALTAALATATHGRYFVAVAGYDASAAAPAAAPAGDVVMLELDVDVAAAEAETEASSEAELVSFLELGSGSGLPEDRDLVHFRSDIITGLVIGFMLLFTVLIGVNCALGIQTPVRYASPAMLLPHTREY